MLTHQFQLKYKLDEIDFHSLFRILGPSSPKNILSPFRSLFFKKGRENRDILKKEMSILTPNPHILYRETHHRDQQHQILSGGNSFILLKNYGFGFDCRKSEGKKRVKKRDLRAEAFWPDLSRPAFVEMEAINDCEQLDQILAKAAETSTPIIIDWMAAWCRKCIYLKPKLEKLAAEYDTKIKFYFVDVNKVPQALVKRGNVTKMPTIQLWKDGEMKAEVIGGHKAWLVLDEIREMIQKYG